MYAIYGNIYHQYTPNVSIYTSTMDPMGYIIHIDILDVYAKIFRLYSGSIFLENNRDFQLHPAARLGC